MPTDHDQRYDFFLSRRGSVAAVAREVADVLTERDYKVLVQDYDAPISASFVEMMHEAVKNSRDLVILFTRDYEQSHYTRREFTSFEAQRGQSTEERHIIILRCEDVPLTGLLADNIYQDLVGVTDPEERKRRIVAAAERQSQAARPPPRPFIGVPPRIASFTGRADELDRLDAILMRDKPAAVTQSVGRAAVQGLGGVGKTSLGTEYAHRYRQLYAGVCWCPAEMRTGLLTSLAGLAVGLGAAAPDEADVEKVAKAALRRLGEQRATWLLIYDNVNSPDEIADLLPAGGARVLITSRFADWGDWADEVSLDVLPLEEAVAFLQKRTSRADANGAKLLAKELGHLPLALDHAAAICKRTQMSFTDYAAKVSSLISRAPRGMGYPRSVGATFDLAIDHAVAQSPTAETVMAFLAFCAPERIPTILIEGSLNTETERVEALAALSEVSLIKPDPLDDGMPAVRVHRLVQTVMRARTVKPDDVIKKLTGWMQKIFPARAIQNLSVWPLCRALLPHALALPKHEQSSDHELLRLRAALLQSVAFFLSGHAYAQAELVQREAIAAGETGLGPNHPDVGLMLYDLHMMLNSLGRYPEANAIKREALRIYEMHSPPDDVHVLNERTSDLLQAGRLVEAEELCRTMLVRQEEKLGLEHADITPYLDALALTLWHHVGRSDEAELLFRRCLTIHQNSRGEHQQARISFFMVRLAQFCAEQRRYTEAEHLLSEAISIVDKIEGGNRLSADDLKQMLAAVLVTTGRYIEAEALYQDLLRRAEHFGGTDHPLVAHYSLGLATTLYAAGRSTEADTVCQDALRSYARAAGRNSHNFVAFLSYVGVALCEVKRFAEAERYSREAIEIAREIGEGPHSMSLVLSRLARILLEAGHSEEALKQATDALAKTEEAYGRQSPSAQIDAKTCVAALSALGRAEEANEFRTRYKL